MSGKVLLQRAQVALHFFIVFLHFLFFLGHRFFSTQSPFKHCFAHFLDFQTSLAASVGSEQAASTASMSNGGNLAILSARIFQVEVGAGAGAVLQLSRVWGRLRG